MVEIIEHEENDQVVIQQTGKTMVVEEEKQTQKLRVLLIDDSVVCLAVLSSQLKHWGFEVTPKREALEAIDLLRRNRNAFDIVFTDVVRFDLDGFHLSEIIKHQFGIPVIMISAKDDPRYIEEGMRCGATYYLVKPVQLDVLQEVCKLVIRNLPDNNNNNLADPLTLEPSYLADGNENPNTKQSHDDNDREDENDDDDENKKKKKKKKNNRHVSSSSGESSSTILKKPRVVWDPRLHQKFVEVVLRLDVEKAVPKKILEMMNEPNLTRENIASHLQKFRNALRKERERFCQVLPKNPREDQQHFLNSTVQPAPLAPGLTINFDNFCSGQEMIMSSNTNFNQQRSLHSAGNHFSQHHHLPQQQLIKNMATVESSNNSSSSLSKTSKTRKTFFMETEYPIIDYRNQKNMFDQEFAMQQLVVYPQDSALLYQETTSVSSSSSSRGNNIGGHHHHQAPRPPRNVQPFQAASGGDVVPYQARAATNVQPFQAVVGVGGGDVVPYKGMAPTNVQSFQGAVGGGGGDVLPHQARTPTNVQPFQSVFGGADHHFVPYQARPPTNVQTFHGGGGAAAAVAPYEVRPPTKVQPFQGAVASDGGDVVVPYQTRPTNVQPSQAGGDGGYGTGNSADTGNKVHLSTSIDDHIVHNYYDEYSPNTMELQPSSQSAGGYSIGGNNNDGYLMLPSIISSNIVPNQASSSQPNTSLEESINNSIVPHQAMPTPQLFQPNTSVEKSINNSIIPNQARPTQQPSQPSTYMGGSIDDSIAGYQALPAHANTSVEGSIDNSIAPYLAGPTQEISQPTYSIGELFDNSFVPYQAMPTHQPFQPTDSIGFIDNTIAPYQAWPTQPNTSLEESIDNSIIPYQAWPTQELSQPTDYIGGSIDFIVPYQAWDTQNCSLSSCSIGGNSGENNGYLLPSINSMVLYQDEHTKQLAQEINSFGGNNGQVGYTQPYITDHSCSFSSLFLSPDENSYFNENKYDYCMQLLPTNNTNADHVHDTSFVGKNINGYDHQMMNPLPDTDSVAEVSSKNIEDLPDEEISFMINELSNYGASPSIS